jgi:metalloendopeptidase OMA1, mitochondrial
VHEIVSRILNANDLGTLRSDPRTPITPARVVVHQPSLGGFGGADGEEGAPDLWDPDANATGQRTAAQGKEWKLLVVNDQKVVNAMAAPGMQAQSQLHSLCSNNLTNFSLGTVVVFTGILPVAKDEQGLAAILGHGTSTCFDLG